MQASTKLSSVTPAKCEIAQRGNPQSTAELEKLRVQRDAIRDRSARMFRRCVVGGRF